MSVRVCPSEIVQAPVEIVWDLLTNPAGYGQFWDFTVERVEPQGPAAPGQLIAGWSRALCRRWRIEGEILKVDAERHEIRFLMSLPFGIIGDNRLLCTRVDERSCSLRFG
jgi:hypothetical protein